MYLLKVRGLKSTAVIKNKLYYATTPTKDQDNHLVKNNTTFVH